MALRFNIRPDGGPNASLRRRLCTAFCVVLSLLFSQFALASYVCPAQADAARMVAMMAAGEPCAGMDPAQPALCHQHATTDAQSFEAAHALAVPLPAIVQLHMLPWVVEIGPAVATPLAARPEARPPPDPVFLTTLRLRV